MGVDVPVHGFVVIVVHSVLATFVANKIDWADSHDVKFERIFTVIGHLMLVIMVWYKYWDYPTCCIDGSVPTFTVHGFKCFLGIPRIDPNDWATIIAE